MIALTNILTLTWLLSQYQSPPPLPQAVPSTAPVVTNCVTITGFNRLRQPITATNCGPSTMTSISIALEHSFLLAPKTNVMMQFAARPGQWQDYSNLTGSPASSISVPTTNSQGYYRLKFY